MASNGVVLGVVALAAIIVFLASTAVTTRKYGELQQAIDAWGNSLQGRMDENIRADLVNLKTKLSDMHGSATSLSDGMKTIDELVDLMKKSDNGTTLDKVVTQDMLVYSKDEMDHIGTLLDELKTGFSQYQQTFDTHEASLMSAVEGVASSVNGVASSMTAWKNTARADGNAAEMGSLSSEAAMMHHAAIAAIRPDLPMLLPTVRLLIGILSGPKNIARRNEVRTTWMKEYRRSLGLARQWSVWFLVSSPKDDEEAKQIRAESDEYGDIMLMSYLTEDYHLIGAKVVEFFHAASLFPQLQFVMKGDDDTFVRVDRLLDQLDHYRNKPLFLGCNMGNMPPIRKANNKRYYMSFEEYSPKTYPRYCSGGGYVLSMDVVRGFDAVGQAAGYEPFKFEDVNTGMLIDIAGVKVVPTQGKGFYCWGPNKKAKASGNITDLRPDWTVFHYVGGNKWPMSKLVTAVNTQKPTIIFQKKLKIQAHDELSKWEVKEVELYGETCDDNQFLGKAFGIGKLAQKRDDNLATTHIHTYYEASSNIGDAKKAFDGDMSSSWESTPQRAKHYLQLQYGVHSAPFSKIGCIKIFQGASSTTPAIDISFWDDDDAEWHTAYNNVRLKTGSSNEYVLPQLGRA